MNDISHKQAVRLIHLRLDGLLNESQRYSLDEHLASCDSCHDYAAEMDALPARLQNEFPVRWDRNAGPSYRVFEHVTTRARKIPMTNRISAGIRLMASGFFVALVILGINFMVLQMKSNPIETNATQSVSGSELINNRLIAFTSEKDGNFDIYTMRGDGSNLANLTNNPAQDVNPVWSPDGKHIAFESDRAGTKQIYLMNPDGSSTVQLTHGEVDHQLPVTYDSQHSIWSSDGKKILFLQNDPDGKTWTLSSININGENKTALMSDTRRFDTASWSPTGEYVGLLLFDELEPDRFLPNIYVIDADGNNLREIGKFLPQEEQIFAPYFWSSDEQSVIFPADKFDPYSQTIYELRLSDNTLTTLDMIQASLFDWYDGIALVADFNIQSQPLVWQRPDGTATTLDYLKGANPADCYIDKERSLRGNLAIGSYCKQDDKVSLYWTNRDGSTIQQLPDLEVPIMNGGLIGLTLSPDEKFVTFNFESEDETYLYIWNMEEALKDSSVQPIKLLVGKSKLRYLPAWQPMVDNDILEEEQTQTDNRLIAFTSKQDGNFDIYTMHADGSGLINITNNLASDAYPFWSPDGKQIAFISDRDRSGQIYLMDADGSNVIQLTNGEGNYWLDPNGYTPWSPDGKKLIFFHKSPGEQDYKLYAMDITDKNTRTLTNEPGQYFLPSWSSNGRYIAFISDNDQTPRDIFVVGSDGNSLTRLTENLPPDDFFQFDYDWSKAGTSIFFTTSYTVYEANVDGSVSVITKTNQPMIDWWNETALLDDLNQGLLSWLRPDGSQSTLELCHKDDRVISTAYKRSDSGNLAFGANCSASGWMLYWANSNGTITTKLLNSLSSQDYDGLSSMTWSPDDAFIAFVGLDINSPDITEMLYVLDVARAREAPSIQPIEMTNSFGPSWQPMLNNEVTEQESTPAPIPEPTQTSSSDSLIAFTADNNDSVNTNTDIYTIRLDGSNLTNLTHGAAEDFNANDFNPVWSPDRKKIAFMSDRRGSTTGNTNIFVMNPDGSDLSQLTYNPGYDAFLSWSPDGEQIIYFSSPIAESNAQGQIIVMNADGSDKTVLTTLGYYYFRSWSPDNQKIVYVQPRFNGESYRDSGIHVVDIDGKKRREWFADRIHQIHWEDSEHFLGVVQTGEDPQAIWTLYQFNTDGSQIELATHRVPIVAIFEQSYVVEGQDGLTWFALQGTPISVSPWNVAEKCETTGDSYVSTSLSISPDQQRALVIIYCKDATWHYLVNEDGSEINQLGAPMDSSVAILPHWSPDGQYVSLSVINYGDDLYLIDIPKMLKDPSATPILLATNVLAGVVYGEPLIASNDNEEKPTPEPTVFSLSVYEAELLAFFDALEPFYLPTGYALEGVAYNPWMQQVTMKYISQQGNASILIYQQRGDLLHYPDLRASTTPVPISDKDGEFIQGAWIYESPDTTTPTWDPHADAYALSWQQGEFVFSIHFIGGETIKPLPVDEFVAIAESLK